MEFRGHNVIVTGGSSGIGKATARLLVRAGANVAIVARRQTLLDGALANFETERVDRSQVFRAYSADLSDWDQAQACFWSLTADGRTPDVLINCAGMARPGYFEQLSIEFFRKTMDIDFFGTLHPCKLVAPMMIRRGRGHIVNFSSVAGYLGVFGYTAYSAAKFAVRGFTDVLRSELRPHGVRVSIVFPPDTRTPQFYSENMYKPLETERISGTIKPVEPERIAQAVIRAIKRRQYIVVPDRKVHLTYALTNGIQGVARKYFDRVIARTRRERNCSS